MPHAGCDKLICTQAISAGDELGFYEILSAVGAGAMREVSGSRQAARPLAIKVLPEHILKRADSRARSTERREYSKIAGSY